MQNRSKDKKSSGLNRSKERQSPGLNRSKERQSGKKQSINVQSKNELPQNKKILQTPPTIKQKPIPQPPQRQSMSINNVIQPESKTFPQIEYEYNNPNFSDDSSLIAQKEKNITNLKDYDIEKKLHLEVRSKQRQVKLSNEIQHMPVMITLRTEDEEQEVEENQEKQPLQQEEEKKEVAKQIGEQSNDSVKRQIGIDLICVIDHSGSMAGQKIALVRDTLIYVLDQLTEIDRICLIQFDDRCQRCSPLVNITPENIPLLKAAILSLRNNGGTDIAKGMDCSFYQLKQRRFENQVTSIFLLSDGLDGGAQQRVAHSLSTKYPTLQNKTFTIHTFGFGKDHDPTLMSSIASLKDGGFYFIEDFKKLDECFIDALAALFSVVSIDNVIQCKIISKKPLNAKCSTTYGEMWEKQNEDQFQIKIPQLISGVSKDFLMELEIPPNILQQQLDDQDRNCVVLQVKLNGKSSKDQKPFEKYIELVLNVYNQNEDLGEVEEDGELMENYCRVQAAQAIKQALVEGEKGNFQNGQQIVEECFQKMEKIKLSKKVNIQKIEVFQKDLVQTKQQCSQSVFSSYGKHAMIQNQKCHMEQRSKAAASNMEDDQIQMYANKKQKIMSKKLQSEKGF